MEELENKIDYKFNNRKLLQRSLTHPSFNSGNKGHSYETFELLGDAALSLAITDYLIHSYPNESEGDLAKRKSILVSGEILTEIALKIELGEHIILSHSEESIGGRSNPHNLENVLEAIIGAIYLDGGIEKVKSLINKFWSPLAQKMIKAPSNPKTRLQEWAQSKGKGTPKYRTISTTGPSHLPNFEIELIVSGLEAVKGTGRSKKIAETSAAKLFIEKYIE